MMRSPPPPTTQQAASSHGYGNPYQPQAVVGSGGGADAYSAYGGFLNDPTAQMGYQVGKTAMIAGQEYMESNVCGCLGSSLENVHG